MPCRGMDYLSWLMENEKPYRDNNNKRNLFRQHRSGLLNGCQLATWLQLKNWTTFISVKPMLTMLSDNFTVHKSTQRGPEQLLYVNHFFHHLHATRFLLPGLFSGLFLCWLASWLELGSEVGSTADHCWLLPIQGRSGGLVVSVLAFYFSDPSSNLAGYLICTKT